MRTDETNGDDFEGFLRRRLHNSTPHIADDGFTDRLVATLPPRRTIHPGPAVALVLILITVFVLVPWVSVAARVTTAVLSLDWLALLEIAAMGSMAMLALAGLVLARVAKLI